MPDQPILLCYDGSDAAKRAVEQTPPLLPGRPAIVLTVWQPISVLPSLALAGVGGGVDLGGLDEDVIKATTRLAEEGAELARSAGMEATPLTVRADGPVWDAIVRTADEQDVAAIVVGARGLTGLRHMLLGSVSEGVVRHARRPAVVIHGPRGADD